MSYNQLHSMPPSYGSLSSGRQMPPHSKKGKWSNEEDALIIGLRGRGVKWDDMPKHLPGRSAVGCRLHYQNYLERRRNWDEEQKTKLARLYDRYKAEMWARVAENLQMPWRAAEAMHWQLGEHEMARRAGQTPFDAWRRFQSSEAERHSRSHLQGGIGCERQELSPQSFHSSWPSSKHLGKVTMPIGQPPPSAVPLFLTPKAQPQQQRPPAPFPRDLSYKLGPHGLPPMQDQPPPPGPLPGIVDLTTDRATDSQSRLMRQSGKMYRQPRKRSYGQ